MNAARLARRLLAVLWWFERATIVIPVPGRGWPRIEPPGPRP